MPSQLDVSTYPKKSEIMSCGGKQKTEDQHGPGNKVGSERKVTMFPLVSGSWNEVPIVKEGGYQGMVGGGKRGAGVNIIKILYMHV